MIHPDLAFEIIKKIDWKKDTEKISIEQSLGRILANDITATLDSPPFDKSAMDGFAYHSSDNGKRLKIIGSIAAGENSELKIKKGECIKIMTGAMIPQEADRVVKIENCTVENGFLTFKEENIDNIIKKGENLKTGEIVLKKCKLQPQHIGILASLGIAEVEVAEQPLVGIITTGTELKNPGEKLKPGQIYNSNGFQITAQVEAMNCKAKYYGTVPDDKEKTRQIIFDALSECDVLILSGGVSKGDFDFVPYMLEENGVEILFHRVAIKPGRPTLFGRKKNKFVFGLPGNPVSTFVIFEVFVKPFLYQLMGFDFQPTFLPGILRKTVSRKRTERVEYNPVIYKNGEIEPLMYHGSSHLNSLAFANALIKIDKGISEIKKGTNINVRQI